MAPIAIIGIGCRFPQANGPDGFWRLLKNGVDAISEVPASRWDIGQFYDPDPAVPGKMTTRWGGFLDQIEPFDHDFFGIPSREAEKMDPQQRLLLEVAWGALEDAGQAGQQLAKSACGVFIGATNNHFADLQASRPELIDAFSGTGGATSVIANRISYCLDLRGPSLVVDTACSSSLVAVHLACQSLRSGESYPIALAGGVNVILSPVGTIFFSRAGAMAPDGRTKVFDAGSNGFARSEGAGVVVLKPLAEALQDRDFIYAVIRGGAVNQDGRSNGLMAPNRWSQEAVLREAYKRAGVSAGQVQYVEVHGTGTPLGDTIEAAALGAVVAEARPPGSHCVVGTVKTNFGHLESAAGIAGLVKVALMLSHRMIPPHLHFTRPNPRIDFTKSLLRIPTSLEPWPSDQRPALAGVSAFAFGGTNAHVVVEDAPARNSIYSGVERPIHLLTLSARTERSLRASAGKFADYCATHSAAALGDICFTANTGRSQFGYRLAVTISSHADATQRLETFRTNSEAAGIVAVSRPSRVAPKLAFLFPGERVELLAIGRQLYDGQPTFRAALDQCLEVCQQLPSCEARDYLFSVQERLFSPVSGHTGLFALEYALAQMWLSWGVSANVLMGDGVGEYVAACVADTISLEDALRLVALRASQFESSASFAATVTANERFKRLIDTVRYSPAKLPLISSAFGQMLAPGDYLPSNWLQYSCPPGRFTQSVPILMQQGCEVFLELGPGTNLCGLLRSALGDAQDHLFLPSLSSDDTQKEHGHWYTVLSGYAQLYLHGFALDWAGFDRGYNRSKVPLPTTAFDYG